MYGILFRSVSGVDGLHDYTGTQSPVQKDSIHVVLHLHMNDYTPPAF